MGSWLLLERLLRRQLPVAPSSSPVACCNLDLEVAVGVEGRDMIAGTCPCSPADLAKQALAEHLSLPLFMVKHCHCPFGQLLLRALDRRRWSRAQSGFLVIILAVPTSSFQDS